MRVHHDNQMMKARPPQRRCGVALVTVLMLLTLLIAVVAEMVSVSGTEAILATRYTNDLAHQLALDSAIHLATRVLQADRSGRDRVDRGNTLPLDLALAGCTVQLQVRSDGAKFDVAAFASGKQDTLLADKIRSVGRRKAIPAVAVSLQPIRQPLPGSRPYLWFDQLFERPDPLAVFHWPGDTRPADRWSDWITVFGAGKVDLQVADEPILTAMLDDLQDGLGRQVLENRPRTARNAEDGVETALQGIEDQKVRDAARSRLGWGLHRYSLQVVTTVGTDARVYYVVLTVPPEDEAPSQVLLRRQIRW